MANPKTNSKSCFNQGTGEVKYCDCGNEMLLSLETTIDDVIDEKNKYKQGFDVLMEHFKFLPDDVQSATHIYLKEIGL